MLFKSAALRVSAIFLSVGVAPAPCFAWGAEGHRIIAAIAADELTPTAKRQVEQLLGTDEAFVGMMTASTWADEIRLKRPNTAPWHFVDIPIGSNGYDANRDCRNNDCVVAQIERDTRIIADKQLAAPVRAEALRFLIHFVGDIHQPLHAADNHDKGGNAVRVVLRQHRTNLHSVWDVDVARALGRTPEEILARLEREVTPINQKGWQRGGAAEWANESFRIASTEIYRNIRMAPGSENEPIILPPDYAEREGSVVREQIEKAGVRLAMILNGALIYPI
jgi:hypothetical protein